MARITFSIPDDLAAAAERRATADRRSLSSYITVLVEADFKSRGEIPADDSARLELLALAAEVGLPAALETLRKKLRTTAAQKKEAA